MPRRVAIRGSVAENERERVRGERERGKRERERERERERVESNLTDANSDVNN